MSKRIIFIAPYPKGQAPSQRFRFEQYLELLQKEQFEIQFHSFLNTRTWNKLYNKGSFFGKVTGLLGSFWRRFILLFKITAAANTGPAKHPRPTSSTPAVLLFLNNIVIFLKFWIYL